MTTKNLTKLSIFIISTFLIIFTIFQNWGHIAKFAFKFWQAIIPFIIGLMVAYVINILMSTYEDAIFKPLQTKVWAQKIKRPVSLILALLTFVLAVVLLLGVAIPEIYRSFTIIIEQNSKWFQDTAIIEHVNQFVKTRVGDFSAIDWSGSLQQQMQQIFDTFGGVIKVLLTSATSFFSWMTTLIIVVLFAIYILASKERLANQLNLLLTAYAKEHTERFHYMVDVLNITFRNFFQGQVLEGIITGILCFIGMMIFRLPFATTISVVTGFFTLIPIFGALIGSVFGVLLMLTVSWQTALWFLLFILVLQNIEGNIIYPRLMGNSLGLPSIWVFVAVTIGSSLSGLVGMVISVPLAATAYNLIKEKTLHELGDTNYHVRDTLKS